MQSKVRLGVSDAAYLQPLLHGLSSPDSPFEPVVDLPASNSIHLNERTGNIRCAFLSPIDYLRYAGPYRIVPDACVSSSKSTRTITLTVKSGVRNIRRIAVDVRVTSEIILARIVLLERLRNSPENRQELEFIPAMPSLDSMLSKADAALIVNLSPSKTPVTNEFTIDLVEEWSDMTGLPYVHGFWVAREEDLTAQQVKGLINAKKRGIEMMEESVRTVASRSQVPAEVARDYLESFSYDFGQDQIDSLAEFGSYAYYHGALGDIAELNFFETESIN
jgi:predicted solute-binding protein